MELNKKPSFTDLVKSEIQDLDVSLLNIPNLWGEDPRPLTDILVIYISDGKVSYGFDDKYTLPPVVKQKVQDIFLSGQWIL